jgi:hypothetical protein
MLAWGFHLVNLFFKFLLRILKKRNETGYYGYEAKYLRYETKYFRYETKCQTRSINGVHIF